MRCDESVRTKRLAACYILLLPTAYCCTHTLIAVHCPLFAGPLQGRVATCYLLLASYHLLHYLLLLPLQERGYGTAKGIPTMVVAAASFDDVLAIAGSRNASDPYMYTCAVH